MVGILSDIIAHKRAEVQVQKSAMPVSELQARVHDLPGTRDFVGALRAAGPVGLIAEVKRRSPSKGLIRVDFHPVTIAQSYANAGAAAISVLTDQHFFGGELHYLAEIRQAVSLPLLRKDFIIAPYQVYQSRVVGADAILLIMAALDRQSAQELYSLATELGLAALVEVHSAEELHSALAIGATVIGINNRDLSTFHTDLAVTTKLAPLVPPEKLLVSESGISTHSDLQHLAQYGVRAVLVGESLMRQHDVTEATRRLLGKGEAIAG